jgi:hypothetical protein
VSMGRSDLEAFRWAHANKTRLATRLAVAADVVARPCGSHDGFGPCSRAPSLLDVDHRPLWPDGQLPSRALAAARQRWLSTWSPPPAPIRRAMLSQSRNQWFAPRRSLLALGRTRRRVCAPAPDRRGRNVAPGSHQRRAAVIVLYRAGERSKPGRIGFTLAPVFLLFLDKSGTPVSAEFVFGGVAIAGERWHELRVRWAKVSRIGGRSREAEVKRARVRTAGGLAARRPGSPRPQKRHCIDGTICELSPPIPSASAASPKSARELGATKAEVSVPLKRTPACSPLHYVGSARPQCSFPI